MQSFTSFLIYYFVFFYNLTLRYRYTGLENVTSARSLGGSGGHLLAIWHQNLFSGILAQNNKKYVVMTSRSKDGEIIARFVTKLGHIATRGSSRKGNVDKGGKVALNEMIEILKSGVPGAITVDGPKGPIFEVKPGILIMSRDTKTPIVPYIVIPQNYWTFKSWDKFRLPKPFSRIIVRYEEPFLVTEDASMNDQFRSFQDRLKMTLSKGDDLASSDFENWSSLSRTNNYEV